MIKYADLVVCDSKNIEKYIKDDYSQYQPKTTFIAYGSDTKPSQLKDTDDAFTGWLNEKGLSPKEYYMVVGRFVPENNYEVMIREFMKSKTDKDFVLITTANDALLMELESKLNFNTDKRIKFVGTVYDQELLKKIRENAYGYLHGHEVGGTNPSLLEAMGSTDLNLLLDVGFNREVGEDVAIYWTKDEGDLAEIIDNAELMVSEELVQMGANAKKRVAEAYSWKHIVNEYEKAFCK